VNENAGKDPRPTELQQRYLHAGRRAATRRQRILLGSISLALGVSIALAVLALLQRNTAISQRDAARSLALVTDSNAQRGSRPDVSVLLALEAMRVRPSFQARSNMVAALEAVSTSPLTAILPSPTKVDAVAYSPDGRLLAAIGDGKVRLWNLQSHRPLVVPTRDQIITRIAFSPDGSRLATLGLDTNPHHLLPAVRLWDVRNHRWLPGSPSRRAASIAFTPHGHTLVTLGLDGAVRRWRGGRQVGSKLQQPLHVNDNVLYWNLFQFGHGGRKLAQLVNGGVDLWDVRTGGLTKFRHEGELAALTFSPDGRILAAVDLSGGVFVWQVATSRPLPAGGRGPIAAGLDTQNIAFTSNGQTLATAGADGAVRLWDVDNGRQQALFPGDTSAALSVAFGPQDRTLARGGDDTTVWLRDLRPESAQPWSRKRSSPALDGLLPRIRPRLPVPVSASLTQAFSPDGAHFIAGLDAGKAWVWNVATGHRESVLDPHDPQASSLGLVAVGAGGTRALTAEALGGPVRLWDVRKQRQISRLSNGPTAIFGTVFSPDGSTLATIEAKGGLAHQEWYARLWDVSTGLPLGDAVKLAGKVDLERLSIAFSPDGRSIQTEHPLGVWRNVLWHDFGQLRARVCNVVWGSLTTVEWAAYAPGLPTHTTCD